MAQIHKDEARAALAEVAKRLESDRALAGLERVHIRALLEYASQQIEQIQELKKQRRTPPAAPPQGDPRQ